MRVVYQVVSGGCTLTDSPTTSSGAASSGVVSSTFMFNQVRASCVVSFTAKFGADSGIVAATITNPASQTRTVVASSVVFGTELAAGPLVAGTAYSFTCEAQFVDACSQPPPARLQHARLRESRPSCSHLTPIVQCSSNYPTDQPQSLLTATCELITPSSAEAARCRPPPEQLQTALSAAALRSMKLVHPACCPSPPTSGRALALCQRLW